MKYIQFEINRRAELYKLMLLEEVIFYDDFEDLMVRSTPEVYFVKRKGTAEFKAESSSKLVTEAILGGKLVSREQYDIY